MNIKEKGAFYTPEDIAVWMSSRALRCVRSKNMDILEPSFGGGIFLKTATELLKNKKFEIDAVEYDPVAFGEVSKVYENRAHVNTVEQDFLFWETRKKYDLVVGNPPYIVKKILHASQAEQCKKIHALAELSSKEVSNIWTAFVVKCESLLKEDGVLAFVLPTELLQVNYAKEIRDFLLNRFKRLEIISFRQLAFEKIEQDTVILLAYKNPKGAHGLFFSEASSIDDLKPDNLHFEKHHGVEETKWSSYILSEDDVNFVQSISKKCDKVGEVL